jgi:Family of unknown function (DUF6504)
MSRVVRLPIRIETSTDGAPVAFTWRGERYHVLSINEPWVLQDRWWVSPAEADSNGGNGYSDRLYYRVRARASGSRYDLFADLYHDRAQGSLWVLDKVHD